MSFLSGLGKIAGSVLGIAGGPVGSLIGTGLGLLTGSKKQGSANKVNQQALQMAMQRYKDTAPLRQRALAIGGNLQPNRPNLSALFQGPVASPFARGRPDLSGLTMPGGPSAPPTTMAATPAPVPGRMGGMANQAALMGALKRRQPQEMV